MPPVGFEPTILASERPKTHALDRSATGSAFIIYYFPNMNDHGGIYIRIEQKPPLMWLLSVQSCLSHFYPLGMCEGTKLHLQQSMHIRDFEFN